MAATALFKSSLKSLVFFQFPFRVKAQACYHNRPTYPNQQVQLHLISVFYKFLQLPKIEPLYIYFGLSLNPME